MSQTPNQALQQTAGYDSFLRVLAHRPRSMIRSSIIMILALTSAIAGCADNKEGPPVQHDKFVKFTSHLGNSFVAPSQWTTTDDGDTFSLKSPDGYAVIQAMVFTSEGSGSLDDFRQMVATAILPKKASHWRDSQWTAIKLGDFEASKRELVSVPDDDHEWRLYVMDGGKYYHAVIVNASTTVMSLNGGFYESIVRSFEGIRE